MKKFLFVVLAMFMATVAFAQSGNKISLLLVDKSTGESVPFATVSLTPDGAAKASKYVLTNDEGKAVIEGVRKGTYTIKAELLGYLPYTKQVKMEGGAIDLGKVELNVDSQTLDAASVSAVGNPIVVKKDTVEYNASSFKTTDNDMLEDLLKKLPGVEVGSDGSITANGKTINKITIDGRTFFLDDPSLASKNLPAKIIEKVKVVEKKSDQAIFTGIDDGEEETIIDLSVRPGMMNGLIGNVMGGVGHDIQQLGMENASWDDARWQTAALVGNFTEKGNFSVIINANNTNNRGFNDLAGSMMSQMRGGGGGGMGGGRGGWGQGNGITTSWMGGLNGAYTLCDGDMDLGGNYLYNGSKNFVTEQKYRETKQTDGSYMITDDNGFSTTLTQGHRFGMRLEHKFSEKTSILFEPSVNFGGGSFDQYNSNITKTKLDDLAEAELSNKGFTSGNGSNRNWSTGGHFLFRQRLGKAGRTISADVRYNASQNKLLGFNQSLDQLLVDGQWLGDPTNQRYDSKNSSYSVNGRLVYTEPLAKRLFLETSYNYGWSRSKQDKSTYDSSTSEFVTDEEGLDHLIYNQDGEVYNPIYSNLIINNHQNHRAGLTLQYQTEKLRLQAGASYQPTITDNETNGKTYHDVTHNWSPNAMIDWNMTENAKFNLFYRGRSSQPSINQLMPVPDNSNPRYVSFGNPYLTPYFSHSVRGDIGYTNKKTFFTIRMFYNAGLTQDGITNASWVDSHNVTYSMPMNGGLTGNASVGMFLNSPIAKSNFSVSNMMNVSFNEGRSYVGRVQNRDELCSYYNAETADFNYEGFYNDVISSKDNFKRLFVNNVTDNLSVMENLRFTYRNDFVEAIVGGMTRVSKPWYSEEMNITQKATWNNRAFTSVQWTPKFGLTLKSDLNYNWYRGYTTEQPSEFIWNATISQLIFKNKATIALNAYDILNQAKNLSVSDTANYHQEVRNNTLGRYIIVSFTYRFGNFQKAAQNFRGPGSGRGPGGPGGPGGRRF